MRWFVFLIVFLSFYLFRLWQTSLSLIKNLPPGVSLKVTARVSQQPYLSASKQIIRLGQFLVVTEPFPEYFYGQKLEIIGKPTVMLINKFQKSFVFNYPTIHVVSEEESLINQRKLVKGILFFRQRLEKTFSSVLPEPQASLISGIVLGAKKQMPAKFTQNLRKTGTIHLVVASGYNITVIAGLLIVFLTKFIRRQYALVISFLGILIYTLMAGGEPPIVRAAIMGSLTYLAQFLGREKDALRALIFSAGVMLLINPLIYFDRGFQLSFLATGGILLIGPCLKGKIFNIPAAGENLKTTLGAQMGVLPVLLANFGQISLFSPLVNLLVLPFIPLLMILGLIILFFGLFCHSFAQIASWFAWVPLTLMIKIIDFFARIPWGVIKTENFPLWLEIGYYLILGIFWYFSKKRKK
ncbi:MAG: ComEC/Rec2 family competence protein [Microgenomates group bacterium]